MHVSPPRRLALAGTIASIALSGGAVALVAPSSVLAAAPATVTVRVEGLSATLVPQTSLTTTTSPVSPDGQHPCSGTSAGGALWDATEGQWSGTWSNSFNTYFLTGVKGVDYSTSSDLYWAFWNDDQPASVGICTQELASNDRVLLFPQCYGSGPDCPNGATTPAVLELAGPHTAQQGTPTTFSVMAYPNAGGSASPAQGAVVAGGTVTGTSDAHGQAPLTFNSTGTFTLGATRSGDIRSATIAVCVHNGNDGNCGTTAPGTPTMTTPTSPLPAGGVAGAGTQHVVYRGPFALVATAQGLIDGYTYSRRAAPRLLQGTVGAHTAITSVSIRLRRSYRGRCQAYSGARERFVPARCGRSDFFRVGTAPHFSYLLPAPLRRGRYVFDIGATDAAGNTVALARGTSRIVFYVR